MTEWDRIKARLDELTVEKNMMLANIESLKQGKVEQTHRSAELTDSINEVSAKIKQVRKSRKSGRDSYQHECESQQQYHCQLLEDQQSTLRDCTDHISAATEAEERWRSRIEELSQILLIFETDRTSAAKESQLFTALVGEVIETRKKLEEEREDVELCLELLGDTMEYFARSKEHIEMNVRVSVGGVL